MVLRKLIVVSRPLMPMLIGLCLGIALSLLFAPFIEETCGFSSDLVSEFFFHVIQKINGRFQILRDWI